MSKLNLMRWEPGMKQGTTCERLRRRLESLLPEFDFTRYPVQYLRPWQREFDRPAWSIGAVPRDGSKYKDKVTTVSVYSQETITECLRYGMSEITRDGDSVWLMAGSIEPEIAAEIRGTNAD